MKLKEVQDRSYEMLCMIDDICRKEGVRYFLDGGTEIASVREKDLIPWDDDIDIKLELEDYPAFKRAMEKHLPEHIHLQEPDEFVPGFYDFVFRVVDDRFLLRQETEEDRYYKNRQNHLGIDVFLHHYIPEGKIRRVMTYGHLKLLYGMGMGHRYRLDYGKYSPAERAAVACMSTIGKLFSARFIYRRYFRAIHRLNRKPSAVRLSSTVLWKEQHRSEWTRETMEGEIRGRKFPIPAGYDAELTNYYGDYMSPPEDRNLYVQHLDAEERYGYHADEQKG